MYGNLMKYYPRIFEISSSTPPGRLCRNDQEPYSCHSEPFAMYHPEPVEGSPLSEPEAL
jgi:hypothetical protein